LRSTLLRLRARVRRSAERSSPAAARVSSSDLTDGQWEQRQVTERILDELREQVRRAEGRNPEPSAGIIDSQSVKGTDTVGKDSRGYDAGKKINVRKRFIVTDTLGLLVVVCVMSAAWQDRDGAKTTLLSTYLSSPIRFVFADQGFAGRLVDWAAGTPENDGRDRA
jgi:hypothetical protein